MSLRILRAAILTAATILTPPTKAETINKNISNSTLVQGNNFNYNTTNNYYTVDSGRDTKRLEELARQFSDANADRALGSKKYHLAAEILQESVEVAVASRRPKKEVIALLSKKSIAESYFNKKIAYQTLEKALELDPSNLVLLKAAADIAIDKYRFDRAIAHLYRIANNQQVTSNPKQYRSLRFEVNHKLHVISALERKLEDTIKYSIAASKIYRIELTQEEQLKEKQNTLTMLQVSLSAATNLVKIPAEFLEEYISSLKIINPNRNPDYLGTDRKDIWVSVKENKTIRLKTDSTHTQWNVFEEAKEAPEYIMGEDLEALIAPMLSLLKRKDKYTNLSERAMLRLFLELQEELVGVAANCKQCAASPLILATGALMVGSVHENYSEHEMAHFYYSLALRKIEQANEYLLRTPHFRALQAELFKKIGLTRIEIIGGIGMLANSDALNRPFERAIKIFNELSIEYPNQSDYISSLVELKSISSSTLIRTFNFEEAEKKCSSLQQLASKLNDNIYALDEKVATAYIECTRTLLMIHKTNNDDTKYTGVRNKFIDFFKLNYPSIDPAVLLGSL